MNKDIVSKKIIKTLLTTFSSLLNLKFKDIKLIDKEFERIESRRADLLCLLDESKILHLEIQSQVDKNMPLRMLRYYTDIKFNYDLPIYQVVVFLGKGKIDNSIFDIGLKYNYFVIDMKAIDCDLFLSQNTPDAIVLSILCDFKNKNELDMLQYIIRKLRQIAKSSFDDYMMILEELSTLRDLKTSLKEVEMILLKDVKYEDLPSYEIGFEKGIEQTIEKAVISLYKYEKNIKNISKELGIDENKVIYVLEKNKIEVVK